MKLGYHGLLTLSWVLRQESHFECWFVPTPTSIMSSEFQKYCVCIDWQTKVVHPVPFLLASGQNLIERAQWSDDMICSFSGDLCHSADWWTGWFCVDQKHPSWLIVAWTLCIWLDLWSICLGVLWARKPMESEVSFMNFMVILASSLMLFPNKITLRCYCLLPA